MNTLETTGKYMESLGKISNPTKFWPDVGVCRSTRYDCHHFGPFSDVRAEAGVKTEPLYLQKNTTTCCPVIGQS